MAAPPTDMLVFLVRHAEPAGPGGKRFLGQDDPPLSRAGEEQARLLGVRLRLLLSGGGTGVAARGQVGDPRFDAVHSSDLARCLQTAEIAIADAVTTGGDATITPHKWLREIDVGLWQGLTWEEARERYPAEHAWREVDPVGRRFPGGESFRDLRERVVPRFRDLVEQESRAGRRRMLVMGHRGVNRVLLAHVLGLPLERIFSIEQDCCAVSVLRVSGSPGGGWRLVAEPGG
jgi:broad specificity phosphatase PhoE